MKTTYYLFEVLYSAGWFTAGQYCTDKEAIEERDRWTHRRTDEKRIVKVTREVVG